MLSYENMFCHILASQDNFAMNPYMFGSFFPALAARKAGKVTYN
jgi:hypothetical protein